jgi:acyl-coenzyme A thioesterase PaaI-like protein
MNAVDVQGPRFFYSEPEALFRVGPLGGAAEHAEGEMLTGEWMRDSAGRPSRGALFVLVDDVFGVAALVHRPTGRWAVTTELSLDFTADAAADGRAVFAVADHLADDSVGGLSQGTVRDANGRVLAVGTVRVRYSDQVPVQLHDESRVMLPHFERESPGPNLPVERLLGAEIDLTSTPSLLLPASPLLANSMGPTHGGILACASEILAITTARLTDPEFVTASVQISFVRPGPPHAPTTLTAEVKHGGRTLQVIEVTSRGPEGKACTIATVVCQVGAP